MNAQQKGWETRRGKPRFVRKLVNGRWTRPRFARSAGVVPSQAHRSHMNSMSSFESLDENRSMSDFIGDHATPLAWLLAWETVAEREKELAHA